MAHSPNVSEKKGLQNIDLNERVEELDFDTCLSNIIKALSIGESPATQNTATKNAEIRYTEIKGNEKSITDSPNEEHSTVEEEENVFSTASTLSEEIVNGEFDIQSSTKDYLAKLLAEVEKDSESAYFNDTEGFIGNDILSKVDCFSNLGNLKDIFDGSVHVKYTQVIPDDNDPYYFCRVCQQRSVSRSAFHHHLTTNHNMVLTPLEYWRVCDPEVIPYEFDASHCCTVCQMVFETRRLYRSHLRIVHNLKFPPLSKEDTEERQAAVFTNNSDRVLQLARIHIDRNSKIYCCVQCPKKQKMLASLLRHYLNAHSIIAEIEMTEKESTKNVKSEDQTNINDGKSIIPSNIVSRRTYSRIKKVNKASMNQNLHQHIVPSQSLKCPGRKKPSRGRQSRISNPLNKSICVLSWIAMKNFYCGVCEKAFVSYYSLLNHLGSLTHKDCIFQCFECKSVLKELVLIKEHFSGSRRGKVAKFKRNVEHKLALQHFRSKEKLPNRSLSPSVSTDEGYRFDTPDRQYSCSECSEIFHKFSTLLIHERKSHNPRDESVTKEKCIAEDKCINEEKAGTELSTVTQQNSIVSTTDAIEDSVEDDNSVFENYDDDNYSIGDFRVSDFELEDYEDGGFLPKENNIDNTEENNISSSNVKNDIKDSKESSPEQEYKKEYNTKEKSDSPNFIQDKPVDNSTISLSSFTDKLMNDGSDLKCDICQGEFETRYAALMHFVQAHKTLSVCSSERSDSSSNFSEKVDTEVSGKSKRGHLVKEKENTAESFRCNKCTRVFSSGRALSAHRRWSHSNRGTTSSSATVQLYCSLCEVELKSVKHVSKHSQYTHKYEQPSIALELLRWPVRCNVCDGKFKNKCIWADHARKEHKAGEFSYVHIRSKEQSTQYINSVPTNNNAEINLNTEKETRTPDDKTQIKSRKRIRSKLSRPKKRRNITKNTLNDDNDSKDPKRRRLTTSDKIVDVLNTRNSEKNNDQNSTSIPKNNQIENTTIATDYVCDICQLAISNRIAFRRHREDAHFIKPVWDVNERYCNVCQCNFKTKQRYQIHSEDVHDLFP